MVKSDCVNARQSQVMDMRLCAWARFRLLCTFALVILVCATPELARAQDLVEYLERYQLP